MDNQTTPTKPNYYTIQGFELWDITSRLPHPLASAVEYIYRHRAKNGVEDLKKALTWLQYANETINVYNTYNVQKENRELVCVGLQKLAKTARTSAEAKVYKSIPAFLSTKSIITKQIYLDEAIKAVEDMITEETRIQN